jgi:transcriptional regulator with XRE-family HTH domain
VMEGDINRIRLAEFLRNRRERLQPRDFGLQTSMRQRAPGLRREDVARLAGISPTYYTWIEQARDLCLSRQVIDGLAAALRLNAAERKYVYSLAALDAHESFSVDEKRRLHPTVEHILGKESTICALVCDPWFNVFGASPLAREVLVMTSPAWPEQNLIWRLCHDRAYASIWPDWQRELRLIVGMFRQNLGKDPHSIAGNKVLEELADHPSFATTWMTCDVQMNPSPEEYFRDEPLELAHHGAGSLRVHRIGVCLPTRQQLALTIFSPSDADTQQKFTRLALHAVARTSAFSSKASTPRHGVPAHMNR